MRGAREPTSLSPSPSASSLTSTPVRKSSRSAPLSRAVEPITTIILTTTKQSAPVTAKRKFEVPSLSSAASAPATPNASADSGPATESAKDSSAMFSLFNCLKCAAQLLLRGFDRVGGPGRFVFVALPIALWATWSGGAAGATINHKQHRSAGLYAWNNFTDIPESVAEKGSIAGFDSESSVVLPGSKTGSGCPATTSSHCLRCNADGCIKCPLYLVTDTRQCVDQCPSGYVDQWSAHTEFMGRVCVPTGYSGPMMAAFAGLIGGFLVCLSLLAVAVMLVKRKRRRKTIKQKLINEHSMDRADFLRQLNEMRPNAEYFLAMLNDTRRQIRKLYLSGEVAAANSYRPLVRDLAKILILLNRPIELIPAAPHDWGRLHAWSEQALDRYKPQVGQLIDFFQTSGHEDGDAHFDGQFAKRGPAAGRTNHEVSIFKPSAGTGSVHSTTDLSSIGGQTTAAQKMHLFGSLISLHEFEEPRPSDPFGSSFNTLKGNLISDLNASSLWLEDEFYKLGFRPQDVITTEL